MRHHHFNDKKFHERRHEGKRVFGIILALLGVLYLLKQFDVIPYLRVREFWPFMLIVVGMFVGIRSRFRHPAAWILLFIGTINAVPDFIIYKEVSTRDVVVPVAIIFGGLLIAFRPRRDHDFMKHHHGEEIVTHDENTIDIDVVFGGRKEFITAKDFMGGSVNVTFAGCELNLMQADGQKPMVLDVKVAFGGLEIIVPSHWEVRNEISPTMGNVEDERMIRTPSALEEKKILILRGSVTFGGVEVKGY